VGDGNPQEPDKIFSFTITASGGRSEDFSLKAGETKEYANIPLDDYVITESDAATTITVGSRVANSNSCTIPLAADDDITVTFTNEYTAPPIVTVSGKICQHNGNGYGQAWAHFMNTSTNVTYDVVGSPGGGPETGGDYSIDLPAGSYVLWADKCTGKCWSSIGYDTQGRNIAQDPGGYICLTVSAGSINDNYDIWVWNRGNGHVTCPTPPNDACL